MRRHSGILWWMQWIGRRFEALLQVVWLHSLVIISKYHCWSLWASGVRCERVDLVSIEAVMEMVVVRNRTT